MSLNYIIKGATIVNDGRSFIGNVQFANGIIEQVTEGQSPVASETSAPDGYTVIDGTGKLLLPGVIDDQVHFRDPGLTHKADLTTESRAAVAGGVTSFMDMPNTVPNTLTQELLEEKYSAAAEKSYANYSFYMGVSNDNLEEVLKTDPAKVCGIKVFLGASTGNMLVDNPETLERLFSKSHMLIAAHCEYEPIIRENLQKYKEQYGDNIPIAYHPAIRSSEACFRSSQFAVNLARRHNTRLHVLHVSTADELALFSNEKSDSQKRITAEVCVHHLWFSDQDYSRLGNLIKWNPAIKTAADRSALLAAIKDNTIDIIATDHAPHTSEEKSRNYTGCPSGGPLVQHSLTAMLEKAFNGEISKELVVEKMCHAPARIFNIDRRGYIRKGWYADLVLVDPENPWTVSKDNILYKCGWSPLEGTTFQSKITHTFVNGNLVYDQGAFNETFRGSRLLFNN